MPPLFLRVNLKILALLLKKQGKRPLLVAGDIYRPAAIAQLQVVGKNAQVEVFEKGTQSPVKTARQAIEYARSMNYDTVILDTAGRLQIDDTLMQELENIKADTMMRDKIAGKSTEKIKSNKE